jgi:hypothetical protein
VEFTVTPISGYQVQATSVSVDLRRTSAGPASVRLAYSKDGGTTWIDQGTDLAPNNAACGITTSFSWDFTDFSTTQPMKFRIYGFNASNNTGVLQLLNVNFYGQACPSSDADGDGFTTSVDCNDNNPAVHPGATEICNGIDDNCDTQIDEGVKTTFYADADNDTYGNPAITASACSAPVGFVLNNTDCNDSNASIKPGANRNVQQH